MENPCTKSPLLPPTGDPDEDMSDIGDDGGSQYHSATEEQPMFAGDVGQPHESLGTGPRQMSPLFLPSPSDTILEAQWETDSARSESDYPESDTMATPRAHMAPFPEGSEDGVESTNGTPRGSQGGEIPEEDHCQPSSIAFGSTMEEGMAADWGEVARPVAGAQEVVPIHLPNPDWGSNNDRNSFTFAFPPGQAVTKRRADESEEVDTTVDKPAGGQKNKKQLTELFGLVTNRQAIRQAAFTQVELGRHFKTHLAGVKEHAASKITKLEEEKRWLADKLQEREKELQAVVMTMEAKDKKFADRMASFTAIKDKLQGQVADLKEKIKTLGSDVGRRQEEWDEQKKDFEFRIENMKASFAQKFEHAEELAANAIHEQAANAQANLDAIENDYKDQIHKLEAHIARLEQDKEKHERNPRVTELQQKVASQAKTIESLQGEIEKRKEENEYLESQLVKLREAVDKEARSTAGREAERRKAEQEAREAAQLQRQRRADQQVHKPAPAKDKDSAARHLTHRGGTTESPRSGLPDLSAAEEAMPPTSSPPKKSPGKKQAAIDATSPAEQHKTQRAAFTPQRAVRPLSKHNGKWKDIKHHAQTKPREFLLAVAEDEADEEEVEDAIVPERKHAKRSADDEDASMASDDVGTKQPERGKKKAKKPQHLASETGDSAPESDEESSAPLTKKDITKILTHVVKGIMNGSPSPVSDKKRAHKRKVNTELLMEKQSEEKWERNLYCELVRDTFKAKFEIENDDEIVKHIPACDEELEEFLGDDTKGPNPDELHIDGRHKISSKWNKAVVQIMVDAVRDLKKKDGEDKKKFESLSERSNDYIEELVVQRLERLRGIWRKAQPKVKENGEVEAASEIEERMATERDLVEKAARAGTRRRARYERRVEVLVRIVEIKRDEQAKDLRIWEWLLELVQTLGEGGVSSDESGVDERTGEAIYRVNRLPWRREMSKEMEYVDTQRKDGHLFSKKGSKPVPRHRNGGGVSRRPDLEGLPKALYDKGWYKDLPKRFRERFKFSEKGFKWMTILSLHK